MVFGKQHPAYPSFFCTFFLICDACFRVVANTVFLLLHCTRTGAFAALTAICLPRRSMYFLNRHRYAQRSNCILYSNPPTSLARSGLLHFEFTPPPVPVFYLLPFAFYLLPFTFYHNARPFQVLHFAF